MPLNGHVDFRALVEANWERVKAGSAGWWWSDEAVPFGPSGPDDGDPAARAEEQWEARIEQERAKARERREQADAEFFRTKRMFEIENGEIRDYYFARTVTCAGVALTTRSVHGRRPVARVRSLLVPDRSEAEAEINLHVHNLVLFDLPDDPEFVSLRVGFAELLHRIDAKHVSAQFMLRGLSRHVLILRLFALRRDMLADLDTAREGLGYGDVRPSSSSTGGATTLDDDNDVAPRAREAHAKATRERLRKAIAPRLAQALSGYEREFQSISRMYGQAAKREARIIYLSGMLVGLVLLAFFSLAAGLLLWIADLPIKLDTFLTCLAAGALGAFVSVLQRMSAGKFTVNHEVGREYVQRLAHFRPFIGSIFGLAVFFALEGGLANVTPPDEVTQRYAFFAFVAFLAGFSERFAKEILGSPSGADTEDADVADSSELGSAGQRFVELAGAHGDKEVVVETTRASSHPAHPDS
jgi:hypothetical protein